MRGGKHFASIVDITFFRERCDRNMYPRARCHELTLTAPTVLPHHTWQILPQSYMNTLRPSTNVHVVISGQPLRVFARTPVSLICWIVRYSGSRRVLGVGQVCSWYDTSAYGWCKGTWRAYDHPQKVMTTHHVSISTGLAKRGMKNAMPRTLAPSLSIRLRYFH